jgi:hypothetical protein
MEKTHSKLVCPMCGTCVKRHPNGKQETLREKFAKILDLCDGRAEGCRTCGNIDTCTDTDTLDKLESLIQVQKGS